MLRAEISHLTRSTRNNNTNSIVSQLCHKLKISTQTVITPQKYNSNNGKFRQNSDNSLAKVLVFSQK